MKLAHALIPALLFAAASCAGSKEIVVVGPDEVLVLIENAGDELPPGQILAKPGQKGIRADVLTAGRYLLDPKAEQWERHPIVHVDAGELPHVANGKLTPGRMPEVGVLTSLVGEPLPAGEFLAADGQRGIRRRVLTPGKYALNPYACKVEKSQATLIGPGRVGVVTRLAGKLTTAEFAGPNERGVQSEVLPPGLYFLNPYEVSITQIRVGYRELTFEGDRAIVFPAKDANAVRVETTIVWGLMPEDAPFQVKRFGTEAQLIDRIIRPQVESIVRLAGSDVAAPDFVAGDAREKFQDKVTQDLKDALEKKNVKVLLALVRQVDVPDAVRKPMQLARIADEETLTNVALAETAKVAAQLSEVTSQIDLTKTGVQADTAQLVANLQAQGKAEVERTEAQVKLEETRRESELAQRRNEIALVKAQAQSEGATALADADVAAVTADVQSLGSAEAYRLWRFAQLLPKELKIQLRYAGTGTSWGKE